MSHSLAFRLWSVLPVVGGLVMGSGCAGDNGATKAETAEDAAEVNSADAEQAFHPGARGHGLHAARSPGLLLRAALHELDLNDAQEDSIRAAFEKVKAARKEHGPKDLAAFAELARGVRAGKIDEASVLAKLDAAVQGAGEDKAVLANALDTLHATLTKEQRRELVTKITSKMEAHRPPPEGAGAHDAPSGKKGRPAMERPGPLGFLLHGLDLTDAQREALGKALKAQAPSDAEREERKKNFEATRATMRARLESFAADTFDAPAFVARPEGAKAHSPRSSMERLVKTLAAIVPTLDPAQRDRLADRLEKGPPMGPPPGKKARRAQAL